MVFLVALMLTLLSSTFAPTLPPSPEPAVAPIIETAAEPALAAPVEPAAGPKEPIVAKEAYDGYFANSVFVGDSIMEGFAQYVRAERNGGVSMLADAKFLTTTYGIRVADIVGDETDASYAYQGQEKPLENILQEMGVGRVFIMLGMNDIAHGFTVEETLARYRRMLALFSATNPDVDIVAFTTTPKTASQWLPSYVPNQNFASPLLNELAEGIKAVCAEEGYKCFDINAVIRDASGNLPSEYSRDDYVHINNKCSAVILAALREFAQTQTKE
jgi:lysophospholipase L1-like esterase